MRPFGYMDLNRPNVRRRVSRVERVGYSVLINLFVWGVFVACMLSDGGRP